MEYSRLEHMVQPGEEGKLLRVLRGSMRLSSSAVKSAKWENRILLNGEPARVDAPVKAGDRVAFLEAGRPVGAVCPEPCFASVRVVYEDAQLAVVDKPAPMATQQGRDGRPDTLENVWYAMQGCPEDFCFRPVNRLDRGTSGLLVLAKGAHAQDLLQRQLHSDRFVREYLAVTEGAPPDGEGVIDLPIGKENAATVRRLVSPAGKPCRTHYRVIRKAGGRCLVRLRLETGRTHQIRVHLQAIGCPVCGDFLYGRELKQLPGRFALHSAFLLLRHPCTGDWLRLDSPLPPELLALLERP